MIQIFNHLKKQDKNKKVLVYGNDIVVQDTIEKMGFYCKFAVTKIDNSGIHADDKSIDYFVIYNYLNKVPNFDFVKFFQEIKRLLKNNGSIIVYNRKKEINVTSVFLETLFKKDGIENVYKEEIDEYYMLITNFDKEQFVKNFDKPITHYNPVNTDKIEPIKNLNNTVIISPYSKNIGKDNHPKNYPYWEKVVTELKKLKYQVVQIGVSGEEPIKGIDFQLLNKPLNELREILKSCHTWMSVDNMIPHLANTINKRGIVIWAQSDPKLFGYNQNVNLLKDKKYLREFQFATWFEAEYNEESFIAPEKVIEAFLKEF